MGVIRRLLVDAAARAPAPTFVVTGAGARRAAQDLTLDRRVGAVLAPRPANVLLLVGRVPPALASAAVRAHDVLSHPRATVWWARDPNDVDEQRFPQVVVASDGDDVGAVVADVHRELVSGRRASERPLLPDVDPNPWRGEGPFGQGGTGMTGGVPYGRPMPERADDRDGLTLDLLQLRIGPLFAPFPPGLALELGLQGDLLQEVAVDPNPFAALRPRPGAEDVFVRALAEPVPVAELELARAERLLRWLADALLVEELPAWRERVLRLARKLEPSDAVSVRRLARRLGRTRVLGWSTSGVGALDADVAWLDGLGPVARASGRSTDLRVEDPAYRALVFEPVVGAGGDVAARWRQRLEEAAQALELAARAGTARTGGTGEIEAPGGRLAAGMSPTGVLLERLPELLAGQEFGDAVTTLVSFDLDLEQAAAVDPAATEPST